MLGEEPVDDWVDLSEQILGLKAPLQAHRRYIVPELVRRTDKVKIPGKHCAEVIAVIQERMRLCGDIPCEALIREGLLEMEVNVEGQLADYYATFGGTVAKFMSSLSSWWTSYVTLR